MKKTIHSLLIIDKSSSMSPYTSRTIEGINSNIDTLRKEAGPDLDILNTQLQFSSTNSWNPVMERDFVFTNVGTPIAEVKPISKETYAPTGGTPLLDAIGYGIERIKQFHGDNLGDDNLKVIVTIFTDGEENSSVKWNNSDIKKMIEHFQSDGKWTFTFVGCGSFENVSTTSGNLGIAKDMTMAYQDSGEGRTQAFAAVSSAYTTYTRSVRADVEAKNLFDGAKK